MIGAQVTKNDINVKMGDIASWLNEYFNQSVEVNDFIATNGGKDGLIAMGFTAQEADDMMAACADLAYMKAQAFDASTTVKKLYGLGIK